ncbi:MAG: HupE/UreJ family protein [Polyangiaceae bacterium]|nr:HupE/UreJ family protein [Polyangiaceae bacterium]
MRRLVALLLLGAWLLFASGDALAHGLDPIGVSVREAAGGKLSVSIDRPAALAPNQIDVVLEPSCTSTETSTEPSAAGRVREERVLLCDRPLTGTALAVTGLDAARVDAVVRVELSGGHVHRRVLSATDAKLELSEEAGLLATALSYVGLGAKHLALGWDHLLFVLGVAFLARSVRRAALALTAFTIGHSLTLSAAALGVLRFPTTWAEIAIAASLVWLALEVVRADGKQEPVRRLAPASGALGLVHGLGFATALAETGLPQNEVPLALACFNIGIEVVQLVFVVALFAVVALARRGPWLTWERTRPWVGHAIGAVAAMLCIERLWLL